ncbi:MAG: hypothetical protein NTZ49_06065 [Candidatus Parcubacteria bacterium]|nr:hypothetical protein [Candidatus Parcubacteria bacterium]
MITWISKRKFGQLFVIENGTERTFTGPQTRTEMMVVYSYSRFPTPELIESLKQNGLRLANTQEQKMYGATKAREVTPDKSGTWYKGALFLVVRIAA